MPAERYRAVAEFLGDLPASPDPDRFVQVDLTKPAAEVTLSSSVVWNLHRGVSVLHALTRYRRHEGLRQFREQFVRRYETREIPLAQALDEENGIGFERSAAPSAEAAPLLAGMPLQHPADPSVPWSRRDAFLLGKLTRALAAGSTEITIEAAEAAEVSDDDLPPPPDAFEVVATVLRPGRPLPLSGLLVSVQDERIVLRSGRLGREVVPRLTTAHNHVTHGLGVYRFLCALQSQQVTPGGHLGLGAAGAGTS